MDKDTIGGGAVVLCVIFIISAIPSTGWFNAAWYAVKYHVIFSEVHVDAQPKDCDFMHAPLGNKDCHYEAAVTAYNADGEVVAGDGVPKLKFSHDTKTAKPIISYDNGKTWDWFTAGDIPDQKVKSVIVTWSKVKDD